MVQILNTADGSCLWCQNSFLACDLEEHVTGINYGVALWMPEGMHNQGRYIYLRGGTRPLAGIQSVQVTDRQIITGDDNIGFSCLDSFGKGSQRSKARIWKCVMSASNFHRGVIIRAQD